MKYELYFDGSCQNNPGGPAGWGFHIRTGGYVKAELSVSGLD